MSVWRNAVGVSSTLRHPETTLVSAVSLSEIAIKTREQATAAGEQDAVLDDVAGEVGVRLLKRFLD